MVFVAAVADTQDGVTVAECAPQGAPLAGGAPAGLVHVQRLGRADPLKQIGVGLDERVGDPLKDRIDRAGADPGAEQLLAAVHDVAARDAVADRQHRDGGVKARSERAGRHVGGQRGACALATTRAAHPRTLMLVTVTANLGSSST